MADRTTSILGISGIILAAVPIFIGLYEYKANNEKEFGKAFLNQQSVVYEDLLGSLGGISTSISNPYDSISQANYEVAKFNFNQLYYGKLNLYQSPEIEKLTDSLYTMINSYDSARSIAKDRSGLESLIDKIQGKVYDLSTECKKSLKRTYDLEQ